MIVLCNIAFNTRKRNLLVSRIEFQNFICYYYSSSRQKSYARYRYEYLNICFVWIAKKPVIYKISYQYSIASMLCFFSICANVRRINRISMRMNKYKLKRSKRMLSFTLPQRIEKNLKCEADGVIDLVRCPESAD